jgi:hypothetical protein
MRKTLLALLALMTLAAVTADAVAHGRGRARVHFYWGPAWYWGPAYYYPPPYYYYPPARPAEPTQYIERIEPTETGSWYYCEDGNGYYPYVKECPAGWRRVPATPPPSAGAPR